MLIDSQKLKKLLSDAGISCRQIEGGCVLEYRDGAASQLVEFAGEDRSAEEVVRDFLEHDRRRFRLTNAVRWLLAERQHYLDRSAGHTWSYGDVGFSSEFNVYEELNRSLKKCVDDLDAFEDWMGKAWIRLESSEKKKIFDWLNKDGPPGNEIEYDEGKHENCPMVDVDSALACARDDITVFLDSLGEGEKFTTEMAEEFAKTRGKDLGSKLIRRLADELPEIEVSHDLLKPGKVSFDFKDGEDTYDLVVRGKKLSKKVELMGLEAAAVDLADDYRELSCRRQQFLNALGKLMATRGYTMESGGFPETEWHFGKEIREFSVPIGRLLTNRLRKKQVSVLLREILAEHGLAQAGEEELKQALKAGKDEIKIKHLPSYVIKFDDEKSLSPEEIDEIAREWVKKIKAQIDSGKRSDDLDVGLWTWRKRRWYERPKDVWVDEKYWLNLAVKKWEEMLWQSPAEILAVNGDFRSVAKFQEWIDKSDGYIWHDGEEDTVLLLRDHLRLADDALDWDSYPKVFGEPPFQVVDKWIQMIRTGLKQNPKPDYELENLMDEISKLRRQEIERFFDEGEITKIKQACANKLLLLDEEIPCIDDEVLEVVAEMGWRDLGMELLHQDWFSRVLYDPESGLDSAGKILQWLSLICPGQEVAKHCGRILQMSPKNVVGRLRLKKFCNVDMADIQSSLIKQAQAETTIAWLRCRAVM
ncbi:MAG: hypothetical protein L3J39_02400 [Verrucomicrobiales bacterium]|nr:hypothetical protein [Verrucomicrobiales bacterium]